MNNDMTVKKELRPCIVGNSEKALFHQWEQFSEVIPPSPMIGGHGGGVVSYVFGIVETESGQVRRVPPNDIIFIDNK